MKIRCTTWVLGLSGIAAVFIYVNFSFLSHESLKTGAQGIVKTDIARETDTADHATDTDKHTMDTGDQIAEPVLDASHKPAVVVLAYMRTGSSLTGDILQQATDALYVFEPLHGLQGVLNSGRNITYVNGTIGPRSPEFEKEAVTTLKHWFTCDLTRLYTRGLEDVFLKYGITTSKFKQCVKNSQTGKQNKKLIKRCVNILIKSCEQSPLRIVKTIRLSMASLASLLDTLPGLKIIHLIRDPRATLASQRKFGNCSPKRGGVAGCTHRLCYRLESDVLEADKFDKKYPNRIKSLFYEELASTPLQTAEGLYNFLGVPFTQQARDYIYNITQSGRDNNCVICTTRKNSTEHVDAWRKTLPPSFIDAVQQRCNYVLRRFDYRLYPVVVPPEE